VNLAVELATFFHRIGDAEAANVALDPVRHTFLEDREVLKPAQEDLDRAIEEGRLAIPQQDNDGSPPVVDAWWAQLRRLTQHNEFQDAVVARDAALRQAIMDVASEETTCVIEFDASCGHSLAKMAQALPQIKFVGISRTETAKSLNERMFQSKNLTFLTGAVASALNPEIAGAVPILFHANANRCYPAFLAALYARCR